MTTYLTKAPFFIYLHGFSMVFFFFLPVWFITQGLLYLPVSACQCLTG